MPVQPVQPRLGHWPQAIRAALVPWRFRQRLALFVILARLRRLGYSAQVSSLPDGSVLARLTKP